MSPLLGPILAQLVTLGVSDRTEVRHIIADVKYSEVATLPRVGLDFGWKHTRLSLGYGPSITVTPLQAQDPNVLIFHAATLAVSQRWQRTTLTLSESGGYGRINFRSQALADPRSGPVVSTPAATPGGTPGSPAVPTNGGIPGMQPTTGGTSGTTGGNPLTGYNRPVTFVSSVTALTLNQSLSPVLTFTSGISYLVTGAVTPEERLYYPSVRGPGAQAGITYRASRDDGITTSASTQLATSSNGNRAWLLTATESWTHRLGRTTSTSLGSGLSLTRNSQPDGTIYYVVFPNFLASITNATKLGRSMLAFGGGVSSAPFIDPSRALVDPRLSANAFVGLSRDRFSATLTGYSGLSVATAGNQGALNGVTGSFNASYRLAAFVSVDSGVRTAWQSFQGNTSVPLSFAFYAGLTFGLAVPLNGKPH